MDEREFDRAIYRVRQCLAECEIKIMTARAAIDGIVDAIGNVCENNPENTGDRQKVLRFDGYRRVK